jgi:hypothetical protein
MLLPCALAASTFEGTVTMKMTSANSKNGPQNVDYSIKQGFLRVDMMAGAGGGSFISDFKNRQLIILMPQQKMYMVRAMPDPSTYKKPATTGAAAAGSSGTSFRDTGEKETILGYPCEKYEVTTSKGVTDIWATDQLGTFGGLPMGSMSRGHSQAANQDWEAIIKGSGFFPLRVVSSEGGKEKMRLEVTAVQKSSLPDSLFTAPDGWRKFDLGSMMGGVLQGITPGARPADGNN